MVMLQPDGSWRRRYGRRLSLAGVALLISACTTAEMDPADFLSPVGVQRLPVYTEVVAERYPVTVEPRVAILTLAGDGAVGSATEMAKLDRFVTAFISNGHGRLTVAVPVNGGSEEQALADGRMVVDRAKARGIRDEEVELRTESSGGAAMKRIVVSYETYDVRVPVCGDWSKESSHDLTNTVHSNYGCSTQRNTAIQVANPGDLLAMREPGPRDTGRSSVVIGKYRAGDTTGAVRSVEEQAALAAVGTGN